MAAQGFRITPLHEDIPSRLAGRDDFMISSNTTDRLLWHAGLRTDHSILSVAPICNCLLVGNRLNDCLNSSVEDFLLVLDSLNQELNGSQPSLVTGESQDIPRRIVYSIIEIHRMLREFECHAFEASEDNPAIKVAIRIVETAWAAVIAGDIDDILEYVRLERQAGEW